MSLSRIGCLKLTFLFFLLTTFIHAQTADQWHWIKAGGTVNGWTVSQGTATVVIDNGRFSAQLFSDRQLILTLKGEIRDGSVVAKEIVSASDFSGSSYHGRLERKHWDEFSGTVGAESITLSDGWNMIGLMKAIKK